MSGEDNGADMWPEANGTGFNHILMMIMLWIENQIIVSMCFFSVEFVKVVNIYCPFDVELFPFDIQNCSLEFGSWTYGMDRIEFTPLEEEGNIEYLEVSSKSYWSKAYTHQVYDFSMPYKLTQTIGHFVAILLICCFRINPSGLEYPSRPIY